MRLIPHHLGGGFVLACLAAACSSSSGSLADGPDGAASTDADARAVRIIRGDPNEMTWFGLTVEGRGLTNHEGSLVIMRIGMPDRPPERLGSGQVRIRDGAFRIEFPLGCEGFLYKQKLLFIDVDADGICTPGVDRVYKDYRFLDRDMTLTLSDSVPAAPVDSQMLLSTGDPPETTHCQSLNGSWPES